MYSKNSLSLSLSLSLPKRGRPCVEFRGKIKAGMTKFSYHYHAQECDIQALAKALTSEISVLVGLKISSCTTFELRVCPSLDDISSLYRLYC